MVEIDEIRQRAKKATKGKWVVGVTYDGEWPVFRLRDMEDPTDSIEIEADAQFIAHARQDIPRLCDALEEIVDKYVVDELLAGAKAKITNILKGE